MRSTRLGCLTHFSGAPLGFLLRMPMAVTSSGVLSSWNSLAGLGAHATAVRFASTKLARLYTLELNKVRNDYRRTPTRAQQEECLRVVSEVPLHCIHGLDGKTVAHCLSTLVVLDAPSDFPLLHECALWLSVHPDALSPHSLAQSLYSLVSMEYPDTASVVRALQERMLSVAGEMAPSSLCMLLASVLTSCTTAGEGVDCASRGGLIDLTRKLSDGVLHALGESLGVTERVMLAVALGQLLTHFQGLMSTSGLFSDHVLAQLSSVVWLGIPSAEMEVISLGNIVGLITSVNTAPASVRDKVTTALFSELKGRVETQPLVSARSAVQVAQVLRHLVRNHHHPGAQEALEKVTLALEAYISSDAMTLDTASKLLTEFAAAEGAVVSIPPSLVRYVVRVINEGREKWSAESVHAVLRVFCKNEKLRPDAQALATFHMDFIQTKCAAGAPVDASEIAALLVEGIVDPYAEMLAVAVANNIGHWSVSKVLTFLRAAAEVNGKPTRAIMRDMASKLVPYIEKATAAQVAAVMMSYGRARVRNDALCDAITNRTALLASDLTLHQASTILGGLAAVEYRDTKLFVDLAPLVIAQAVVADSVQTTSILASYAKMLVWNFKVVWSFAERAAVICDQLTLPQILAVVISLNRMDVQHPNLVNELLQKVIRTVANNVELPLADAVMILSAFSRSGVWDTTFFESLGKRVVKEQKQLNPEELAETLMAFARVGLAQYNIFEDLTLRTLEVAPTCPLMALANMTVAFAIVGCRHEELFSIVADRFVNQKTDVPAVTIASVLSAFASVGIRNDRLFIEAIPRVRHVGQYGTPKDITNVVYAYAQVGLWHYKLFVRLADRAIQLRGEFRCHHLARLLEAYARVDMRYEKLFVEFSPRVQTIAHLLTAGEVAKILSAYAKVRVPDVAVFKTCGDRAMEVLDTFESEEAQQVLDAFKQAKISHNGISAELTSRFPQAAASAAHMKAREDDDEEEVSSESVAASEVRKANGIGDGGEVARDAGLEVIGAR